MPPISAFAAYKNLKKDQKKKQKKKPIQQGSKNKEGKNKSKGKNKDQKTQPIDKKRRLVTNDDDNDQEDNEVLTFEQYMARTLDSSRSSEDEVFDDEEAVPKSSKRRNQNSSIKLTSQDKKKLKHVDSSLHKFVNGIPKIRDNLKTSKISKSASEESTETAMTSTISIENVAKSNSILEGEKSLQFILSPVKLTDFFSNYWERNSLLVQRNSADFYASLISFKAIDQMLLDHHVEFTKNIDVTTYENGVRETHNPEGRALPPAVWEFYREGCSVRLLNPQTFLKPLHELCATLQEYFHCLVGANAYLTPPNSQGFAPHYDDIEAFVLQIEGRKRWKLYSPRSPSEVLPRYSSKNFTQDEIGEPILDRVLEPGDLLYFPRGAIHQASTEPGFHSLHITLSVYQKQSYADLLEKMLPIILKGAIDANVNLRRGLPLNIWHNAGLVYNDIDTQERAYLEKKVTKTLAECLHSVQLSEVMDAAVDELAKKFQHEALPPFISSAEKPHTIFGLRNEADACGDCLSKCPIELRTNVRLLRANILRLVSEEEQIRIYYYLDNSKEYCEYEPNFFEIEPAMAGSVEVLVKSYPEYVSVSQLPLEDDDNKLDLVTCLWNRGLLMTEKPIQN